MFPRYRYNVYSPKEDVYQMNPAGLFEKSNYGIFYVCKNKREERI